MRYDSSKVTMTEGELRIQTQPGDINGTANENPRNFILQDLPNGDWTVETRLQASMIHRWQLAGLLVYEDDDNYVKFDIVANNDPATAANLRAELVSERNASFGNGGNRSIDLPGTSEDGWWHLRLTRTGNSYEGWISADGANWTSVGAPVTNNASMSSVGLMAIGPQQEKPVTVAFDYFRLAGEEVPEQPVPVTYERAMETVLEYGAAGLLTQKQQADLLRELSKAERMAKQGKAHQVRQTLVDFVRVANKVGNEKIRAEMLGIAEQLLADL